ncbi:XrtA/PEP-CTERM system-associated ATPase [Pelagibius marinus]|uniref:XrtA/PEP-CTERM system-associated ATPase n=1 Tax=Pelagibius marinus TaxID=2762760 RepID=UPI001872C524|nr:XrtA/PEP-CTERM system-associated ATPase [Pelagibius marinus]
MKYTEFFNLGDYPFNLTPDLRFYYRSQSQRRALAYLSFGLSKGEGFVVITGEIGAGKTVFIDYFLSQLPQNDVVTATITSTQFEADSFLRMVASAFGLQQANADKATVFRHLEEFLRDTHRRGVRAILIIDEAQGLPVSALEELRMLSNVYHRGRPMLQVFLVGQPEFRRNLAGRGLEQLRQRIVAIHHLTPLKDSETREYILFRLTTAGWADDPAIAAECFPLIHQEARGVPRLVNNLCDRLLWHAFIEEKHAITVEDVEMVIGDMRLDASGLTLDGEPSPEIDLGVEPEEADQLEEAHRRDSASAGTDRVVGFHASHGKDN